MNAIQPRHFIWVTLISGALWFALLGYRDLFDPDEGRYAEIPAAMVDTGDWLTPRMDGLKYFEKPALQYWMTAVVYTVAGKSNATARFFPALLGWLCAGFAAFVAFRLFGREAAFFTLLIALGNLFWVAMGHLLTLDMTLSVFLVLGMGSLVIAQNDRADRKAVRRWMLAGWAALALAVLTKGLIGVVLPAASLVVYSLWQRDWAIWKHLHLVKGLLLFLLLTAPWFVAVSVANPGFAWFFFVHEHWQRYTSEVHNREGPLYYFVPFLLLGLLPWLVTGLRAMVRPMFTWLPGNPGQFSPGRLLWCFVTVTFVFFSLGDSKLPAYILPVIPVVAILAGVQLSRRGTLGPDRWVVLIMGAVLFWAVLNLPRFADELYTTKILMPYKPWLLIAGSVLLAAAAASWLLRRRPALACALVGLSALLAFQSLMLGAQSLAVVRSGRAVADAIMRYAPPDAPIYAVKTYVEAVPFYVGRNVTLVDYSGELDFGLEREPERGINDVQQFVSQWRRQPAAVMIVDRGKLDELFPGEHLGEVVYTGPKGMVVVKK